MIVRIIYSFYLLLLTSLNILTDNIISLVLHVKSVTSIPKFYMVGLSLLIIIDLVK